MRFYAYICKKRKNYMGKNNKFVIELIRNCLFTFIYSGIGLYSRELHKR